MAALGTAVAAFAWESRRRRRHPVPPGHRPEIVVPHRDEFEVWHNALSLCSMKTRVCLAELGIPYATVALVTDHDAGVDGHVPVTMETVLAVMRENVARVRTLLETAAPDLP